MFGWGGKPKPVANPRRAEFIEMEGTLGGFHRNLILGQGNPDEYRICGFVSAARPRHHDLIHLHIDGHGRIPGVFAHKCENVVKLVCGSHEKIHGFMADAYRKEMKRWEGAKENGE